MYLYIRGLDAYTSGIYYALDVYALGDYMLGACILGAYIVGIYTLGAYTLGGYILRHAPEVAKDGSAVSIRT